MNTPTFKPSDVVLHLVGTMGRTEREQAAILLIRASVRNGDTWGPLSPVQVGEAILADLEEKVQPLYALNRNPFFRPDLADLVAAGFAHHLEDTRIEFTPKGLEAVASCVRPTKGATP